MIIKQAGDVNPLPYFALLYHLLRIGKKSISHKKVTNGAWKALKIKDLS